MPAYPPEQMTDEELDLLARWLTHSYLPTTVEDYPDRRSELPTSDSAAPADDSEATAE